MLIISSMVPRENSKITSLYRYCIPTPLVIIPLKMFKKYVNGSRLPNNCIILGIASLGKTKPDNKTLGSIIKTLSCIACS